MFPRLTKAAVLAFLCSTALLGADAPTSLQNDRVEDARQGLPTFHNTNPFGLPGAVQGIRTLSDPAANGYLIRSNSPVAAGISSANTGWSYLGLLGLLGLIGLLKRPSTDE